MLDVAQVSEIGAAVARDYLPPGSVLDVSTRESEGPDGEDGLTVLVVLRGGDVPHVTGDQLVNLIYQLHVRLNAEGKNATPRLPGQPTRTLRPMAVLDPDELLEQAELLIRPRRRGPPRQVDVRRAISSAYYALFHFIMTRAADSVVGSTKRRDPRYGLVYRSVDHVHLRSLCQAIEMPRPDRRISALAPTNGFGGLIKRFAAGVQELQVRRHAADYDPQGLLGAADAAFAVSIARETMRLYEATPADEQAAFLTLLLFKRR